MENRLSIASACTACLAVAFLGVLINALWPPEADSRGSYWLSSAHQSSLPLPESFNILYHLGGNGPWIPKVRGVTENGMKPPASCRVQQVHMVSPKFDAVSIVLICFIFRADLKTC